MDEYKFYYKTNEYINKFKDGKDIENHHYLIK